MGKSAVARNGRGGPSRKSYAPWCVSSSWLRLSCASGASLSAAGNWKIPVIPGASIPIQPVNKPILCSPYEEPTEHWVHNTETGAASPFPGRWPTRHWFKHRRTADSTLMLPGFAEECENSLWRAQNMPDFNTPLRPQRRLGGKIPCLSGPATAGQRAGGNSSCYGCVSRPRMHRFVRRS